MRERFRRTARSLAFLVLATAGCVAPARTPGTRVGAPSAAGARAADTAPSGRDSSSVELREGAGASLVPLAPTRVRRALEEVRLRRDGELWQVECLDVFVGGPLAEVVPLGLPEFEPPSEPARGRTVSDLSLHLDGVEIASEPAPAPEEDVGAPVGIRLFHSWHVPFAPEEVRVVRVRYRLLAGRAETGEELLFFYLNPGTPWAGPSGRINLEIQLADGETSDLVADWLRPADFLAGPSSLVWRMDLEEPEQDLVLALRPPADWLAGVPRRDEGLLSLAPEARQARLAAGTPREWQFWRAHLWARHGEAGSEWATTWQRENWFRKKPTPDPVLTWSGAERALLLELESRLESWEKHALPGPEEARDFERHR